jgi:undecaprenyl-diphosphatase
MHSLLNLLAPILDPIVRFDFAVVQFFNQFADHSVLLDRVVALVEELFIVKGGLFMAAMYWLWFLPSDDIDRDRIRILRGLAGTLIGIAVTLSLDHFLPNRPRPLNEPALGFVMPFGTYDTPVADNSFPSDHGAMFFAVATIVWLRSRSWGIVAYIYTVIVIFLPRIYAGHHYPSDIVAGCAIGAFFVWLAVTVPLPRKLLELPLRWEHRHPSSFYAVVFMFTVQVASLFWDLRIILHDLKGFLSHYA